VLVVELLVDVLVLLIVLVVPGIVVADVDDVVVVGGVDVVGTGVVELVDDDVEVLPGTDDDVVVVPVHLESSIVHSGVHSRSAPPGEPSRNAPAGDVGHSRPPGPKSVPSHSSRPSFTLLPQNGVGAVVAVVLVDVALLLEELVAVVLVEVTEVLGVPVVVVVAVVVLVVVAGVVLVVVPGQLPTTTVQFSWQVRKAPPAEPPGHGKVQPSGPQSQLSPDSTTWLPQLGAGWHWQPSHT
jgi:hypothetical protein